MVFKKDVGIVNTEEKAAVPKSNTGQLNKINKTLEALSEKLTKEEKVVSYSRKPKKKGFVGFLERNAFNIIISLIIFVVAGFVALAFLNSSEQTEQPTTPSNDTVVEDVPIQVIDEDEYEGILLAETPNAGEQYLEETIFIGDSNTNRFNTFDIVPFAQTLAWDGMGIRQFLTKSCIYFSGYSGAMTIPEAIEIVQPRRIVFNFGTNDLADLSTSEFIEHYEEALDAIVEAYPYTDIIIASVHPLGVEFTDKRFTNEAVNSFNAALLELAKSRGLSYLNYYEVLVASNGYMKEDYIDTDGLHLTRDGAEALIEYMLTHSLDTEDTRPMPLEDIPNRGYPPTPVPTPTVDGGTGSVSTGLNISYIISQVKLRSGERGLAAGETAEPGPSVGYTASGADASAGMEEAIIGGLLGQFAGGNITGVNVTYSAAGETVVFTVTYSIIKAAPVVAPVQTPEPVPEQTPVPEPPPVETTPTPETPPTTEVPTEPTTPVDPPVTETPTEDPFAPPTFEETPPADGTTGEVVA